MLTLRPTPRPPEVVPAPPPSERTCQLRELRRRWVAMGAHLDRLGEQLGDPPPGVPLARLRRRASDLAGVREALYEVQLDLADPALGPLVARDGALLPFLTGLYIFVEGVIEALSAASPGDEAGAALTARLAHASHYYFDALVPAARGEIEALAVAAPPARASVEGLREHVEELFFAARWLHEKLGEA